MTRLVDVTKVFTYNRDVALGLNSGPAVIRTPIDRVIFKTISVGGPEAEV